VSLHNDIEKRENLVFGIFPKNGQKCDKWLKYWIFRFPKIFVIREIKGAFGKIGVFLGKSPNFEYVFGEQEKEGNDAKEEF